MRETKETASSRPAVHYPGLAHFTRDNFWSSAATQAETRHKSLPLSLSANQQPQRKLFGEQMGDKVEIRGRQVSPLLKEHRQSIHIVPLSWRTDTRKTKGDKWNTNESASRGAASTHPQSARITVKNMMEHKWKNQKAK